MSEETYKIPAFDGSNFGLWKKRILAVLRAKKLEKTITDDETKINELQDSQAQVVLLSSLDQRVAQKIAACETALDIWKRLLAIYENTSAVNVGQVLESYYSYRKDPKDDMSTHISKVEALAIQLSQIGQPQSDVSVMSKMLHSLPSQYDALKEAWDSVAEESRTRDNLTARLLRYDRQLPAQEGVKDVALVTGGKSDSGRMPERSYRENVECHKCHRMGHYARECRARGQRPNRGRGGSKSSNFKLLVVKGIGEKTDQWVIDSGASQHICCRRDWFSTFSDCSEKLQVGNEDYVEAVGYGNINVVCKVGKTTHGLTLRDVRYIPQMSYNLFSTAKATKSGATIKFDANGCKVELDNEVVAIGQIEESTNLCILQGKTRTGVNLLVSTRRTIQDWHKVFGHVDPKVVQEMIANKAVEGMELSQPMEEPCAECPLGKATRASHTLATSFEPKQPGDLVDLDLIVSLNRPTIAQNRYVLLATDRYSGYRMVDLVKTKDEVFKSLQVMIGQFEAQSGKRIRKILTDQGPEFMNSKVETLCGVEHIELTFSAARTPEQNGAAERSNRTIVESARTMIVESGLDPGLWGEAVGTAVYLRNRLPRRGSKLTPFEIFTGRKPFCGHLVPFGTPVQVLITDRRLGKFDAKTEPGYVVGYTDRSNTYRIFSPKQMRVKVSCDLIFRGHSQAISRTDNTAESPVTYATLSFDTPNQPGEVVPCARPIDAYFDELAARGGRIEESLRTSADVTATSGIGGADPTAYFSPNTTASVTRPTYSSFTDAGESNRTVDLGDEETLYPRLSESERIADVEPDITPSQNHLLKCTGPVQKLDEPSSYAEAMRGPHRDRWRMAVGAEIAAHVRNKTWQVVKRPNNVSLLTTKWVFTIKRDADGRPDRFKGRLVARGFQQREGIDFFDTYAPVARSETIRTLLALAAIKKAYIEKFDVATAFLHGKIDEDIWIETPEGIEGVGSDECLKLNKALYGLRQAPKVWNSEFDRVARELGLTPTRLDTCLYANGKGTYLAIYVDDGMVVSHSQEECLGIIKALNKYFEVRKVGGDLFLGMKIDTMEGGGYFLSQSRYIGDVLERFNMIESKPEQLPMADPRALFDDNSEPTVAPYRAAIGSLLYLALGTRPDILFPVILLSKFCEKPKKVHWEAVKRVMRYLVSTPRVGLTFPSGKDEITISAYCDASHGEDLDQRKSTTGVLILLGRCPVIFSSRQQTVVAQSSTEAEYVAAASAAKELIWLIGLLREMNIRVAKATLYIDNKSTIHMIKTNDLTRRSKHIELKFHYVRDMYKKGYFGLEYVPSKEQKADFLTKRLAADKFFPQINAAGLATDKPIEQKITQGSNDREGVSRRSIVSAVRKCWTR